MSTTWSGPWDYESTTMSTLLPSAASFLAEVATDGDQPLVEPVKPDAGKQTPAVCLLCDMTQAEAHRILYILEVVVIPAISIVGLFGNLSSIAVLARQGLKRSSNILLMAVSFSDSITLVGISNILKIWRTHFKTRVSYEDARALYIVNVIQTVCLEVGYPMTVLVTVLITLERVIAVYLPLKFPIIVRPLRTKVALLCCLLPAILKGVTGALFLEFSYNKKKEIPRLKRSEFYKTHQGLYDNLTIVWDYSLGFIPVITVCLGCIAIGIKVSLAASKRQKMLSSSAGVKPGTPKAPAHKNRTTLTLLAVCIQFTLTLGIGFLVETLYPDETTWISYIVRYRITYVLYTINCSSNFIIYVALNKNFRETYVSILLPWRKETKGKKTGEPDIG
ncbi:hypothetical protein RRG08_053135 [Elysia crispata]|uniref:G-protein coupled receptors family 1 profile domain-containing protein n=1 Tax=Elysia crispata TaxID=231223 RepID=A0AAE1AIY3_9GAST|nr:hypothetical protein RRG08_053135 [Elysia crispata]